MRFALAAALLFVAGPPPAHAQQTASSYESAILLDKLPRLDLPTLNKPVPASNDNDLYPAWGDAGASVRYSPLHGPVVLGSPLSREPTVLVADTLMVRGAIKIAGDVEIYVNELQVGTTAGSLTVPEGASLKIFMTGGGTLNGSGLVNETNIPSSFRIFSDSTEELAFTGGLDYAGVIYAPKAPVTVLGDSNVYGALVGQEVAVGGTLQFHSDEASRDGLAAALSFHYDLDLGEDLAAYFAALEASSFE